jgi:hypothetical protein
MAKAKSPNPSLVAPPINQALDRLRPLLKLNGNSKIQVVKKGNKAPAA